MSKVSDVYDALVSLVETNLSTRRRLPNIIDFEDNPSIFLQNGFVVSFGPANANPSRSINHMVEVRTFDIGLVNQIDAHQHNSTSIASIAKTMLEDALTLKKLVDQNNTIGGVCIKTLFSSDTGIEFLEAERGKYFLLTVSFEAEYFEDLT